MVIKKFKVGQKVRTFQCCTKCPDDVGIEMQEVINTALSKANKLVSFAYETNVKEYPGIVRPNVYVYIREDSLEEFNAFTDGQDIYLSALMTFGMVNYIHERLNTMRIDGGRLVPDGLENTTSVKIYERILELIVAHELMHIWHGHQQWKKHKLHYVTEAEGCEKSFDEILYEHIELSDTSLLDFDRIDELLSHLIMDPSGVTCQNIYDVYYIQQILELDADCGAIQIVMQKMHNDLHPFLIEGYNSKDTKQSKKVAIMRMHGYELGLTIGAAALMLDFFDRRRKISSFDSLNYLLASDHPIPAIRFFEMDKIFLCTIGSIFTNQNIPHFLIDETNAFAFDILAHNKEEMHLQNCFWMPALTMEAQRFIALLNRGWNCIHDSLQIFSQTKIREPYGAEDLEVAAECVKFDINGEYLRNGN